MCSTSQGIFVSEDSGFSWRNKPGDPALGSIYAMTERANGNIVAIASNSIAESANGGDSWTMLTSVYGLNNYGAHISESPIDSILYYGADKTFYKSTTGGRSWLQIWNGNIIDSYAVDDSGWIFLGVRDVGLLRSTDGGDSFSLYSMGYTFSGAQIIRILTNHSGGLYLKLFQYPDWILHYENGQVTEVATGWTNPPLGVTEDGNLIFKSGNSIGLYNHITRQSTLGSWNSFIKDQFAQKAVVHGNIWVTSFSSRGLHRSTDKGHSWTDINAGLGVQQCLSLLVTDDEKIYVGTFGSAFWGGFYETIDTGRTWTNLNPLNYDAYFIDISRLKNGAIAAAGSYGIFIYYNDVGQNWVHPDIITLAYSQFVSSSGTIFVGDIYNGIYVSLDNGSTWIQSNNGLHHSYFFAFGESSTGRVFAAAWPSGAYYTDNNGRSWTVADTLLFGYDRAFDFKFKGKDLFAGTSSGMAVSHDDGGTWTYLPGLSGAVQRITVVPTGDILASIPGRGIFSSSNNGMKWEAMNIGLTDSNIWNFALDRTGRLFAASSSGVFFTDKYSSGLNQIVQTFALEQNFPNPFNGTTTIRYTLPQQTMVTLSIFNTLGQKIMTLVQETEDSGTHVVKMNGSTLASGVYFYRLDVGRFVETRKLLLIK